MKIHTPDQLFSYLEGDISWRKKELITFKLLIDRGRTHQGDALRRAGIALLYAHWEGFVKCAGTAYVHFVAAQRVIHKELRGNFLALAIKAKLGDAIQTSKASVFNEVATYFVEKADESAKLMWDGSVQTKSNLSADRFREIILTLGLDYAPYETKEKTIIERLRIARNKIAHGRYLDVDQEEYEHLHGEVLAMLENFRSQIDIASHSGHYRRS